jgi:hypothetical protein
LFLIAPRLTGPQQRARRGDDWQSDGSCSC